jgi:hypothetical protein
MKLNKAIKILEEQKQKIVNNEVSKNQEWIVETASYIKDFFGFESVEYSRIAQFKWGLFVSNEESTESIRARGVQNENDILQFIDNCKRTLSNKGLFKEPKNNLLSDKSNASLIGILFAISSLVFGVGFYFGTEKTNNDLIRTENELNKLKDSFLLIDTLDFTKGMTDKKEKIAKP